MWRGDPSQALASPFAGQTLDEVDFWAGNQKLATYQISIGAYGLQFALSTTNVYFGGKLVSKGTYSTAYPVAADYVALAPVAADRLGSIGKFYPYGQEKPSATTNDTEKFTGYYRDASTGLDYADQRYHQPGVGRFMTPDPSTNNVSYNNPGSLNMYTYANGDPANNTDPTGLDSYGTCISYYNSCGQGSGSEIPNQMAFGYIGNGGAQAIADALGLYNGQVQAAQSAAAAGVGINLTFGPNGPAVTPIFTPQGPCPNGSTVPCSDASFGDGPSKPAEPTTSVVQQDNGKSIPSVPADRGFCNKYRDGSGAGGTLYNVCMNFPNVPSQNWAACVRGKLLNQYVPNGNPVQLSWYLFVDHPVDFLTCPIN